MKPTFRLVTAALAAVALSLSARAITISFYGEITDSADDSEGNPLYAIGAPWRITMTVPEPLTSTGNPSQGIAYVPSSLAFEVGGVVIPTIYQERYLIFSPSSPSGNGIWAQNWVYTGSGDPVEWTRDYYESDDPTQWTRTPYWISLSFYSSSVVVTGSDGLLLPSIPMEYFDGKWIWFNDLAGVSSGVVTGYSVPDSSLPSLMMGAIWCGLAMLGCARRGKPRR
jgi:hypothetical protein